MTTFTGSFRLRCKQAACAASRASGHTRVGSERSTHLVVDVHGQLLVAADQGAHGRNRLHHTCRAAGPVRKRTLPSNAGPAGLLMPSKAQQRKPSNAAPPSVPPLHRKPRLPMGATASCGRKHWLLAPNHVAMGASCAAVQPAVQPAVAAKTWLLDLLSRHDGAASQRLQLSADPQHTCSTQLVTHPPRWCCRPASSAGCDRR